jgi:2,3-bisphosphoglycerate-independent phosphoglycerate mutase
MKWGIVIPDGAADQPLESLGGRTPLQAARLPNMDRMVQLGMVGTSDHVPLHLPAGSEVANLSLLGYDPNRYFTGRAPIEAAAQGIELLPGQWAVRCNLVTIVDQVMVDFTADHISTAEARGLLESLQASIAADYPELEFVTGVSYRNLMLLRPKPPGADAMAGCLPPVVFTEDTRTQAPHDWTDLSIVDAFPRGPGSGLLTELMQRAASILAEHPINLARLAAGRRPATHIWLWGQGQAPQLLSFESRFGLKGAMITAVDLLAGLAALVGWDRIPVAGATGYLDTDYAAKGAAAVAALQDYDVVCVHVEAPDEASHEGRPEAKIEALEAIDQHVVGPLLEALQSAGDYRLLVLPDHPTPVATKKHAHGVVPLAVCGTGIAAGPASSYDELAAGESPLRFPRGWEMMDCFIQGKFDAVCH